MSNKELDNELNRLRKAGYTYEEIGKKVNLSTSAVFRRINKDKPKVKSFGDGIICLKCKLTGLEVVDTRKVTLQGMLVIRRRRECLECKERLTTYELAKDDLEPILEEIQRLSYWKETILDIGKSIFDAMKEDKGEIC